MPELPEVETVRRGLEELVIGETISSVDVLWDRIIALPEDTKEFEKALEGETFEGISRRGKFLVFSLTTKELVSHLRMEGKYQWVPTDTDVTKHTHVIFHTKSGHDLRYLDVRKFGRMQLVEKGQAEKLSSLAKLGPEPREATFDLQAFSEKLKRHTKSIKAVLLDQSAVAGLGNIYVDEALFAAGIHPARSSLSLTEDEISKLHEVIINIIQKAITKGGTTIRTYANAFGDDGTFQKELTVYGRRGESCIHCGTAIEKETIAQRGTHFCPHCQPLEEKR